MCSCIWADRTRIPFTYVDNCAEAIVLAGLKKGVDGEVFNVVDDDLPSSRQFPASVQTECETVQVALCSSLLSAMRSAICGSDIRPGRRGSCRRPSIAEDGTPSGRRPATATQNLKTRLGWTPKVPTAEGLRRYFESCRNEGNSMLKVAIVGCGKIADAHASQIQRIKGCEIVGVCDREPLMARQLYERFPVKQHFSDLTELLSEAKPDVVHITTPPESHFDIAKLCLEWGCHVYVEKPFTLCERRSAND